MENLLRRRHYFVTAIEIKEVGEKEIFLPKAMVSAQGVFQVFGDSEYAHRAFLAATIFNVTIDGNHRLARLVLEKGREGSHFNLRFLHSLYEEKNHLKDLLASQGFESPWRREFARLPIPAIPTDLEHPVTAIITRVVGKKTAEVRNFSLLGMMFEFSASGSSLGEYVGKIIKFDLITNQNSQLRDIEGRIARIYDEMIAPGKLARAIGVKFVHMPRATDEKYKDLILGVCVNIKNSG